MLYILTIAYCFIVITIAMFITRSGRFRSNWSIRCNGNIKACLSKYYDVIEGHNRFHSGILRKSIIQKFLTYATTYSRCGLVSKFLI